MHEASAGQRCRCILVRGQTRRGAFAAPKGSARRADRTVQKQAVERADAVDGIPEIQPGALDSLFLNGPAAKAPPRRYLAAWQRPKAAFFRVPKKSMSDCLMLLASAWLNSYEIGTQTNRRVFHRYLDIYDKATSRPESQNLVAT